MLKILLAEDNADLRRLMRIYLTRAGYEVHEAADGLEALDILQDTLIHLMIVDVMMPRMDGNELVRTLRESNIFTPVLMVTARESLSDKQMGFRSGADDYLVKPVDMDEMLLHVEALLRRSELTQKRVFKTGGTELNEDMLSVFYDGHEVQLRQKEFLLLQMLLSHAGKIFTRQALMDEIWGYDCDTDLRTVDVHIKRLREKLADNRDFSIETVRGLGYKVVLK